MTGTKYDELKEKVVEHLKEKDFTAAIMEINNDYDLYGKTKANYIKDVLALKSVMR